MTFSWHDAAEFGLYGCRTANVIRAAAQVEFGTELDLRRSICFLDARRIPAQGVRDRAAARQVDFGRIPVLLTAGSGDLDFMAVPGAKHRLA
ncbi:MAG TPA: hypothetical protein VJT49_05665 [Amycolatopsis sp.]|uniref:hypothetical protein n=1 Tax=Amycolatopsis sp. TaxID=37632 RepID=UPI002B45FA5B|nr:hypothetical protein [Amycolatopsis sp.]HKS44593.1 hypothetical protein [Amycolatopsis sp.]